MESKMADIDFLLIGKSGGGKSSLGNSITLKESFRVNSSTMPNYEEMTYATSEYQGHVIKVVDSPGILTYNDEPFKEAAIKAITAAIATNPSGYHMFLIVLKVTNRFTREDQNVIMLLKKIFGENVIRDFGIIVMTCGDVFEKEKKITGLSFKQWCAEQRGPFKDLLIECDNRIVLFDNFVQDKEAKEKQLSYLLKIVHRLTVTNNKYKEINISMAKTFRERILREDKIQELFGTAMKELGFIISLLKSAEDCEDWDTRLKVIAAAHQRAETLCKSSENLEFQPREVHDVFKIALSLKAIIWDQLKQEERIRKEGKCDKKWFTKAELINPRQTLHELEKQHKKLELKEP